MALNLGHRIGGVSASRDRRHWARLADQAADAPLGELRAMRGRARALKREVDRLIHEADGRLALPLLDAPILAAPLHADWTWRPPLWAGPLFPTGAAGISRRHDFGPEAALHHDCAHSEITARQVRNRAAEDVAPYGLEIDVFRFEGSFLSLAIELPAEAMAGLGKRHILGISALIETERDLEIFARLNIRHGPNTEQMVREIPGGTRQADVSFDLAYAEINEKRIEKAWIDLIFEGPEMNAIALRSLTMARWPRAEI